MPIGMRNDEKMPLVSTSNWAIENQTTLSRWNAGWYEDDPSQHHYRFKTFDKSHFAVSVHVISQ